MRVVDAATTTEAVKAVASPAAPVGPQLGLLMMFALVGLFAGAVRAAQRRAPRPALGDVLAQASGGAFTAFLAGLGCLAYFGESKIYASLLIVGVAGWAGTILLDKAVGVLELWAASKSPFPVPPPAKPNEGPEP